MRLTLRTMLAFLDDVLQGPDAKELEQKIDESKFASDLVHRIRSSMRRLRLGAPKVAGRGIGADANSVAEYLDNTMPSQQVPEFEKVCLESDVQLAEVAACHQILTMVLDKPAAVDPTLRERMYRIAHPDRVEDPVDNEEAAATEPPVGQAGDDGEEVREDTASRVEPARRDRGVRVSTGPSESGFPLKSLSITLLLGFVVSAVALRAIAPFDRNHPVWRLFAGSATPVEVAQQPVAPPSTVTDAGSGEAGRLPQEPDPSAPAESNVSNPDASPADTIPPSAPASDSSVPAADRTVENPPAAARPGPAAEPTTDSPLVVGTEPSSPAAPVTSTPPPLTPLPATESPTIPVPGSVEPVIAAPAATPAVPDLGAPVPVGDAGKTAKPGEAAAPIHVGRYISEGQVLARMDPDHKAWMAMIPNTPLAAGEPLLSLPAFRPQIVLAPSVKLTVAGEAFLRLQVPDAVDVPRLTLDFGRIVLIPVGEMGNSVQVDFGGRAGRLTFGDNESTIAAEVRHYLPPGSDPMTEPANLVVQLWSASGSLEWQEPDRPAVRLTAGQRLQFIDETPIAVVDGAPLPEWIEGFGDIDRLAAQALSEFLTTDRPLALSLMERTNHRRVEVRSLACRCLCYLDIFEPAIAAFTDIQLKTYWPRLLEAIQSTMPFGRESVTKLKADLEKLHGGKADRILGLLRSYSPEQLGAGGAAELVDALEDELVVVRVIAFYTLLRITDRSNLFRPEERPDQERPRVEKWRRSLKDGQIVYKVPPSPLPPAGPGNP
jgi:hypothetical protein